MSGARTGAGGDYDVLDRVWFRGGGLRGATVQCLGSGSCFDRKWGAGRRSRVIGRCQGSGRGFDRIREYGSDRITSD